MQEVVARQLADELRRLIRNATGCNASIGIASNLLLARIATSRAKPDGVHHVTMHNQFLLLQDLAVSDLPGIGASIAEKCAHIGIKTCGDLRNISLNVLKREVGERTGETLASYVRGEDERVLENKPRQSLGADINWGIRFTNVEQVDTFLLNFSEEVYNRLANAGYTASHLTVNAKKKLYEGEPMKYLGCGHCEDMSRSMQLPQAITSSKMLYKYVSSLYKQLNLVPTDVRGVGIHLKKLQAKNVNSWFTSGSNDSNNSFKPSGNSLLHSLDNDGLSEEDIVNHHEVPTTKNKSAQASITAFAVKKDIPNTNSIASIEYTPGGKGQVIPLDQTSVVETIKDDVDDDVLIVEDNSNHSASKISMNSSNEASNSSRTNSIKSLFTSMGASNASSLTSNSSRLNIDRKPVEKRKISDISSFFNKNPSVSSTNIPSKKSIEEEDLLDGVDMAVWNSLPQQIREEQLMMLKQQKKSRLS
jgi:hypothetical protein